MSEFVREIDSRFPTETEIEQAMRRARLLRAQTMRNGLVSIWSMLQRAVSRREAAGETRHA